MLRIHSMTLGPAVTNTYIIANETSNDALVIDPSWDGHLILDAAKERGWRIANIWLTHAHFDHFGGSAAVADGSSPPPPVALHPEPPKCIFEGMNCPSFSAIAVRIFSAARPW